MIYKLKYLSVHDECGKTVVRLQEEGAKKEIVENKKIIIRNWI